MVVRETAVSLHRDSHHPRLAHEHFTGSRRVDNVVLDRLCFAVQLDGRRIRQRKVANTDFKPSRAAASHSTPVGGCVFAPCVVSRPRSGQHVRHRRATLHADRATRNSSTAWSWEYRGRCQDGAQSLWLTEDEASDSFSSLEPDVFHALWELYHPDDAKRPRGAPTRGQREVESRERALRCIHRYRCWQGFHRQRGPLQDLQGHGVRLQRPVLACGVL